ncbi:MAG: glutamine--tRNA ligase/YqeY domain fusion protein [Bacteroidetes bacterium]|nr:glutamine--tRNA ligase/YqeY domain fusion protein [Bacteroidota bacterium]
MTHNNTEEDSTKKTSLNFIEQIIEKNLADGKNESHVHTRFPPEPNGYLHIGHAKSICLNFGLAQKYNGLCNLRFDDTNPVKEDVEYVDSILEDVKWLGFDWEDRLYYASDYFDQLFDWAVKIIKKGKAYVDDQSAEEISSQRGTPSKPGMESPFRNRSIEENLDLFQRMKSGEFPNGARVLRAKVDMASPNMQLRDPAMYRIKHARHHRTGDQWCIYPMYDFAHGQSDYIEGITNSICTMEFEVHRPLYDWYLDQIIDTEYRPVQTEFARLNLSYTIMSKRKLLQLVEEKYVNGWDDPRIPTLSGLRRRGYTPDAIRNFAETIGVAKRDNVIDVALLEYSVKQDLNKKANRVMAVLDPIKVVITNYPEGQIEELEAINNPENESEGKRKIQFSRELYIERSDFMEDPPRKFFRLTPDKEVRLRYAYIIKCNEVIKNAQGEITELHCTYDPDTRSGSGIVTRKVKGTIHWLSITHALEVEVRLYDRLFLNENPDIAEEGKDFKSNINPNSLTVINGFVEDSLANAEVESKFQFERTGYFCVDKDTTSEKLVFNRTVPLRDSWAKMIKK